MRTVFLYLVLLLCTYSYPQKDPLLNKAFQYGSVIFENSNELTLACALTTKTKYLKKIKTILTEQLIDLNTLAIIGILMFLFLVFMLWYRHRQKQKLSHQYIKNNKKQQELKLLAALIEGETIERKRIAENLHDSVNGNLSAIKHNLSAISSHGLSQGDTKILGTAIQMIDQACEQVRNISHNLVPPSLLNFGLIEAMEQYCHRISATNTIQINFQHFGNAMKLPIKIETCIYHILQELITNSVKHAKAKTAILQIHEDHNKLHITVEDDGIGFNTNKSTHGLGLNNIKSRVDYLNAEIDLKSDNQGTSITIDLDLNKIPTL